jgi:U3 small nucleolar RNA-associated protein 5
MVSTASTSLYRKMTSQFTKDNKKLQSIKRKWMFLLKGHEKMISSLSGIQSCGVSVDNKKILLHSIPTNHSKVNLKNCDLPRDHASTKYNKISFASSVDQPLVAIASKTGSILVYDTRTGKLSHQFKLEADLSSIAISKTSLFASTAKTGEVIEYDLDTDEEKSRFVADDEGLSCICLSEDEEPLVAAARTSITVWKNSKKVAKYTGHGTTVISMAFLSGGALASINEQERFVSIWPANTKKARHPLMTLTCPETLRNIRFGPRLMDGDEASIIALSGSGAKSYVWRIPSASEGHDMAPQQVSCTITVSEKSTLLACDFHKTAADTVICMVQTNESIDPLIIKTKIASATSEGGLLNSVEISLDDHRSTETATEEKVGNLSTDGKSTLKRLDPAATVLQSQTEGVSKRVRAISSTSIEDERPLMTRLMEYSSRLDQAHSHATNPINKASAPSSLTVALEQALQTEDKDRIEAVLQTSDAEIVAQTVERLSPSKVPVLLRELALRLQGKPGRAVNLLIWISSVLEHHGTLLSTDNNAKDALRSVYAVADARVQMFDRLLRLKGRLDLILSRDSLTGVRGSKHSSSNGPVTVFDATNN